MARIDAASRVTAYGEKGTAIEAIAVAPDGTLWVGTDHGLNHFDPATGRTQSIGGLPDRWVPDLAFDRKGRLWIGTHGGAVVLENGRLINVAQKIHRAPFPAEELVEDASGRMWIGPRLRVDADHWTAQAFGPADGSAFPNIFIASRAATRDGRLLFGSPQGLLVVDPAKIRPWTYAPPVVATFASLRDRSLRVEFAALDLSAPERIVYRYELEGHDRAWTVVDANQRSLMYASLPAGNYTLRVAATNRDGVWSPHELRLPVSVPPLFYETWWFRAGAALLIAALIYIAYRLRVRHLRARSEALERVVAARTEELRVA